MTFVGEPVSPRDVEKVRKYYQICEEGAISVQRGNLFCNLNGKHSSGLMKVDISSFSIRIMASQLLLKRKRPICIEATSSSLDAMTFNPMPSLPTDEYCTPSGEFVAQLMALPGNSLDTLKNFKSDAVTSSATSEYVLEVWRRKGRGGCVVIIKLPPNVTPWQNRYGGMVFPFNNERMLAFVAEVSTSHLCCHGLDSKTCGCTQLNSWVYKDEWGEQLKGCSTGRIVVVNIKNRVCKILCQPEDNVSLGEVSFLPDASALVCTGWNTHPYRRSAIWLAQLPSIEDNVPAGDAEGAVCGEENAHLSCDWVKISDASDFASWSPTAHSVNESNLTQSVAYLALEDKPEERLPHNGPVRVKVVNLKRESTSHPWVVSSRRAICSIPQDRFPPGEELSKDCQGAPCICSDADSSNFTPDFKGIFNVRLSNWNDPGRLWVETFSGFMQCIAAIDTIDGGFLGLVRVPGLENMSIQLLDVKGNMLLCATSAPTLPDQVILCEDLGNRILGKNGTDIIELKLHGQMLVNPTEKLPNLVPSWSSASSCLKYRRDLEAIRLCGDRHWLLRSLTAAHTRSRCLAVVLHGGPHSVFPWRYDKKMIFLTMLGMDILAVNYRGSTGFGQADELSLLGKVGRQDVDDTVRAVEEVINKFNYKRESIVVLGGSHGGFLTCHLIGQYPSLFRAASVRNPVTYLPSMIASSDIPDWVCAEVMNEDFTFNGTLATDLIVACHRCSPAAYASDVKAPLLIALGDEDKRVPVSQGLHFYKLLAGAGKPVRLLRYPKDHHGLDDPATQEDYWLNTGLWFIQHLGISLREQL